MERSKNNWEKGGPEVRETGTCSEEKCETKPDLQQDDPGHVVSPLAPPPPPPPLPPQNPKPLNPKPYPRADSGFRLGGLPVALLGADFWGMDTWRASVQEEYIHYVVRTWLSSDLLLPLNKALCRGIKCQVFF